MTNVVAFSYIPGLPVEYPTLFSYRVKSLPNWCGSMNWQHGIRLSLLICGFCCWFQQLFHLDKTKARAEALQKLLATLGCLFNSPNSNQYWGSAPALKMEIAAPKTKKAACIQGKAWSFASYSTYSSLKNRGKILSELWFCGYHSLAFNPYSWFTVYCILAST